MHQDCNSKRLGNNLDGSDNRRNNWHFVSAASLILVTVPLAVESSHLNYQLYK